MKILLSFFTYLFFSCTTGLLLFSNTPPAQNLIVDKSTGLSVPPGFEVDLIYKVDRAKYGSWISMTFDNKGRLVVSDQYKAGTFLIDIPEVGKTLTDSDITKLPLKSEQWGMLYAFDHL